MGKSVVIVDDHPTLGDVMGQMVRVMGHQAHVFSSPADCLAWLGTTPVDVAFLDMKMPGIDGVTLMEQIRLRGFRFPVVAITGYPADDMAREARELGALAVLTKPISMELLQGMVEVV